MPFFKTWDKLNRYIIEHVRIKFNLNLVNKKTWGKMYFPNVKTDPTIEVNPVDLRNSPDFVCLYGVNAVVVMLEFIMMIIKKR